jgi:hypothetical protein
MRSSLVVETIHEVPLDELGDAAIRAGLRRVGDIDAGAISAQPAKGHVQTLIRQEVT